METAETIKIKLKQYRTLREECSQIRQRLEVLNTTLYYPQAKAFDGMPHAHGSSGDPLCGPVASKIELEEMYRAKLEQEQAELLLLERAIDELAPEHRVLIRHRYIDGAEWERIAENMGYSLRAVHYHHWQALQELARLEALSNG